MSLYTIGDLHLHFLAPLKAQKHQTARGCVRIPERNAFPDQVVRRVRRIGKAHHGTGCQVRVKRLEGRMMKKRIPSIVMLVVLMFLTYVPALTTWLPSICGFAS